VNAFCVENNIKHVVLKVLGQVGYLRLYEQHFTSRLS
jgi:hypothetical protein